MCSWVRCCAAALLTLFAAPGLNRAAAQTPAAAPGQFIYGVNLPWFEGNFGHDLGPEPQHPEYRVWYDGEKVSHYFNDIRQIGFSVVRVWAMERGEGWLVDHEGIITGLDDRFLRNLDDLVQRAGEENLKIYLCLTTGCGEIKYPSHLKDERQQKAYLEHAVRPIARRFKDNETIFAFDVINEIESDLRDAVGPDKITPAQAQEFIRKCVQVIKREDARRLVSSGSGYHGVEPVKQGFYRHLGLDFYDVHVYRDDGYLPDVRDLHADRPVIVGECGQGSRKDDAALQRHAVTAFYRNAKEKGYAGCFVWAYGPEKHHGLVRRGQYQPVVSDLREMIKGR